MLGVKNYEKSYIDSCKANITGQLESYKNLIKPMDDKTDIAKDFEYFFFRNLVVLLDAFFVHRIRAIEGKDGNPLNEVRIITASVLNNKGKMTMDNTIKFIPEKSVLKFNPGDDIIISEKQFTLLANSFFTELEKKYL